MFADINFYVSKYHTTVVTTELSAYLENSVGSVTHECEAPTDTIELIIELVLIKRCTCPMECWFAPLRSSFAVT